LGCDLIFVDPDNGLEVRSVKAHQKTGPKYTFFEELIPFVERGQSLVIYHHLCRSGPAEVQVKERLDQLKEKLGINNIYALLYKRGTLRAFFIVPSSEHIELLKTRGIRLTTEFALERTFFFFCLKISDTIGILSEPLKGRTKGLNIESWNDKKTYISTLL